MVVQKRQFAIILAILSCVLMGGESKSVLNKDVDSSEGFKISIKENVTLENAGQKEKPEEEEMFYVYFPLGIVNNSLTVVGPPIVYRASNLTQEHPHLRNKRQIGINTIDALLGGALGGGFGGLLGGTVLAPLGPIGAAVGGGVGAGLGGAFGGGFAAGGPGGFVLGGAGGLALGTVGGLLLGPTGSSVLGLLGGGLGGALGSIG